MFGYVVFQGSKDEAADESGHADDYEPDVDFKPIIPLPDLVEVKTGEEEEEKLFGNRAKLYRLIPLDQQDNYFILKK